MAKSDDFKDALISPLSPKVFKKAYLFKRVDDDVNGNISSFHDVKTMYRGSYDHDKLGIYSDLHYSEWDHSYGTEGTQLLVTPDDSTMLSEAWTKAGGGSGTIVGIAGGSTPSGTLRLNCSAAQTLTYTRSNIIETVSSATADTSGSFTFEIECKKDRLDANDNPVIVQIKCGTFWVLLTINRTSFSFQEPSGAAATTVSNFNLQEGSIGTVAIDSRGNESGQTVVFRIIIDKKRASKCAVLLVDGQEMASFDHTVNNTSGNEVKWGYNALPSATSNFYVNYVRYHNSSFFPQETYQYHTTIIGDIDSTTAQPSSRVFTRSATTPTLFRRVTSTRPNRAHFGVDTTATGSNHTFTRNVVSDFNVNSIGNAFEIVAELRNGGGTAGLANADFTATMNDGTRSNVVQFLGAGSGSIVINPGGSAVTIVGVSPISTDGISPTKVRMVVKGTNTYVWVNDIQYGNDGNPGTTAFTNSSATATFSFVLQFSQSGGTDYNDYRLHDVKFFRRPAFPTRSLNIATIALLDGVSLGTDFYKSEVVVNDVASILNPPVLATAIGFQRDLCYGDSGFTALPAMQYRGDDTVFLVGDASPSWTSITPSTDFVKRDYFTKFETTYFQVRIQFTAYEQELNFMRFHRQLDVTDYVTKWGSSSFSRDPVTRALSAGNLNTMLMNPDGDFNIFRDRTDLWIDAAFEIWVGVIDESDVEHLYPDFLGIIQDMTFNEAPTPYVTLEVTNIIKIYKDLTVGTQFPFASYNQLKVFAGAALTNVSLRQDPNNPLKFFLDSKYPVTVQTVYVDGVEKTLNTDYRLVHGPPVNIFFISSSVGGTPTVDIIPDNSYLGSSNANDILRFLLEREAKLLKNFDIDNESFEEFDTFISSNTVGNIEMSNIKLLDFLETLTFQLGHLLYIKDDSQCQLAIEKYNIQHDTLEKFTYNNIDDTYGDCGSFSKKHPIENLLNVVDIKFDSPQKKKFFTYVNRLTVADYDQTSPNADKFVLQLYGKKQPTKLISQSTGTSTNLQADYPFLTSLTDVDNNAQINYDLFGNRPPLYDVAELHLNVYIYSLNTILEFHRETDTSISDTIRITRIDKDYDNDTGSFQGISNLFFEIPGGAGVVFSFATDLGTGTINETFWVAVDATDGVITGATKANPVVVTSANHGLSNGSLIEITGVNGMIELNGNTYTVASSTTNTFALKDSTGTSNVNGTGFTTYTSGGEWESTQTSFARS